MLAGGVSSLPDLKGASSAATDGPVCAGAADSKGGGGTCGNAGELAPEWVSVRSGGRSRASGSRNTSQEPTETESTKPPKKMPRGSGQHQSRTAVGLSRMRFSMKNFLSPAVILATFSRGARAIRRPASTWAGRRWRRKRTTRDLHLGFSCCCEYTPDQLP